MIAGIIDKSPTLSREAFVQIKSGGVLLSQGVYPQVPSALTGLTAVFGMGTGVSPSLRPPEIYCQLRRTHDLTITILYLKDTKPLYAFESQGLQSKHEHKSKPSAD